MPIDKHTKSKLKKRINKSIRKAIHTLAFCLAINIYFTAKVSTIEVSERERKISSSSFSFHYGWIDGAAFCYYCCCCCCWHRHYCHICNLLCKLFNYKIYLVRIWRKSQIVCNQTSSDSKQIEEIFALIHFALNQQFLFHQNLFCFLLFGSHKNSERNESWSMNWFKPDGFNEIYSFDFGEFVCAFMLRV